jgi:hypothetical protein
MLAYPAIPFQLHQRPGYKGVPGVEPVGYLVLYVPAPDGVLAATLFAHESATFDVHVLAGLGGDGACRLAGDGGRMPRGVSLAAGVA